MALEFIDIDMENKSGTNAFAKEFVRKVFKVPFAEFDSCPDLDGAFRYCPTKYVYNGANYLKGFGVRVGGYSKNEMDSSNQIYVKCYSSYIGYMPKDTNITTADADANNSGRYNITQMGLGTTNNSTSYFRPKLFRAYKIDTNGYFLMAYKNSEDRDGHIGHPIAIYGIEESHAFYFGVFVDSDNISMSDVTYKNLKGHIYPSFNGEKTSPMIYSVMSAFSRDFSGIPDGAHSYGMKYKIPVLDAPEAETEIYLKVKSKIKEFDNLMVMQSVSPDIFVGQTYLINGEQWLCLQGNNLTDNSFYESELYPTNAALLIKK